MISPVSFVPPAWLHPPPPLLFAGVLQRPWPSDAAALQCLGSWPAVSGSGQLTSWTRVLAWSGTGESLYDLVSSCCAGVVFNPGGTWTRSLVSEEFQDARLSCSVSVCVQVPYSLYLHFKKVINVLCDSETLCRWVCSQEIVQAQHPAVCTWAVHVCGVSRWCRALRT